MTMVNDTYMGLIGLPPGTMVYDTYKLQHVISYKYMFNRLFLFPTIFNWGPHIVSQ